VHRDEQEVLMNQHRTGPWVTNDGSTMVEVKIEDLPADIASKIARVQVMTTHIDQLLGEVRDAGFKYTGGQPVYKKGTVEDGLKLKAHQQAEMNALNVRHKAETAEFFDLVLELGKVQIKKVIEAIPEELRARIESIGTPLLASGTEAPALESAHDEYGSRT
jgi:hypothetical protein